MSEFLQKLRHADLSDYTSLPFWSWNNDLDPEELVRQIRAMYDNGIHGFIMHARTGLKVEYLSERWFQCIEACLDEAKRLHMQAYVYDENGWPSGFAGGILLKDPANLANYLLYEVKSAFDPEAFCVYTVHDGVAKRIDAPVEGETEYHCVYRRLSPANTDILNPDVVSKFIDITYAEYERRFGDRFGHELMGFFTDEPQYFRAETPYTPVAEPIWTERYGGDIRDGLVYLFILSEAGYAFRYRYYSLLNELYTQNYYKRIFDWCTERNVVFTGHSIEEGSLEGQMLGGAGVTPSYEYETMPGIDHLGRTPYAWLSGKQVGSAAQQLGKKFILTETFGCSGWDATPRELRLIAEGQFVRGVNRICQHLSSYSLRGQGKLDYPPSFTPHNTWWPEYRVFNEYFDRLSYLIANSREATNALVINPVTSVYLNFLLHNHQPARELDAQLHELSNALTDRAISWQIADERILARHAHVEDGQLSVGLCKYRCVILPACLTLSASTKALLQAYMAAGGHVYAYGMLPAYTEGEPDDYSFITEKLEDHYGDICAAEPVRLALRGRVPFTYREGDGYRLLYMVNETKQDAEVALPDDSFAKVDLTALTAVRAEQHFTLPAGESAIFLKDESVTAEPHRYERFGENIADRFTFVRGDDNAIQLDLVSISKNGVDFDEPHNVYEVFERLVKDEDYQGDLWVKYAFTVKTSGLRLRLLAECSDQLWMTLNGQRLTMQKSAFDVFFQECDISGFVHEGVNELVYQVRWHESPNVRYALYDPDATESLRNCLALDTEVEPVYLFGNFKIDADRALIADDHQIDLRDIPGSGYRFFCGRMTFAADITPEQAEACLKLDGRYMVCHVRVNGEEAGASILENTVPITLKPGEENHIELTLVSSLRNLFGPHHLGFEPDGVGPDCFHMRGSWENGQSARYHADYTTVPFGLTGVTLCYAK